MISDNLTEAVNKQINAELFSSYLYLSMSAWFQSQNFPGFANWMRVQSGEEKVHAMKLFDYLVSRGARVRLAAIDAPQAAWTTPLAVFEDTYKHEQKVTAMIDNLMQIARDEKDNATAIMLQWFVTEQVEEEESADQVVQQLKRIGESGSGLVMMDHQLGKRE